MLQAGQIIRKSWIDRRYVLLSFALIPLLLLLLILVSLFSSPYLGLEFKRSGDNWILASVDKKVHGDKFNNYIGKQVVTIAGREIQQDDLVRALDNVKNTWSVSPLIEPLKYFGKNIKKGVPTTIVFKDKDVLTTVKIIPFDYPILYYFSHSYVLLILAFATLSLGLIVIAKQPGELMAIAFYTLAIVLSTHEISLSLYESRDITLNYFVFIFVYYLTSILGYASVYYILYFSLVFPRPLPIALNRYYRASLFIVPPSIVLLSSLVTLYVYPTIPIACLVLAAGAIIYNYITISSPELKAQMRVILFGFIITIFIVLMTYFIPMLLYKKTFISMQGLMLFSFIIPLSMVFAITKYKLMDIDTLFDNTLLYTLTIGLLVLVDIVAVYLLSATKLPFLSFSGPILPLVAVWVVIFTYIPLRDRLNYFIKKIFKREMYDINQVSLALSEEFVSINSEKVLIVRVVETIDNALHPKDIVSCIYDEQGCPDKTGKSACCINDLLDLSELPDRIFTPEPGNGRYPDDTLVVPLRSSSKSIGYFVLYQKHSGRLYDSNDRKLLSMIANLAASAIERIRYREKDMKNAIEKANMSREIHDSVGNTFVQAVLLSDTIGRYNTHPDGQEHISNLKKILSDGINDMRDLLWAVEQSEAKLGELVYYIGHKIESLSAQPGIKFNMTTSLDQEDKLISPNLKLNIIRIIQESITNIIKHANATAVDIVIHQRGGELLVLVKDNGKGFDMERVNQKENSYGMRNIKKRCEEVGGQLMIDSTPSKGTEISVSVPIDT